MGGRFINRDFRGDNRPRETRINERIRARDVRLIDEDGQMIGVMTSIQALGLARERNLDLVEVSPMATPPVCKLMDYGRFKYEQAKKENEARKHQKTTELKEIRMRPRTDDHDLTVKVRKIEEFLGDGDKVKVGVIFRGRELAHPELGRRLLERVIAELKAAAVLERPPIMEGKMMSMIMTRAPGWEPPKRVAPEPRDRKEHDADTAADQSAATDLDDDLDTEDVDDVDETDETTDVDVTTELAPTPVPEFAPAQATTATVTTPVVEPAAPAPTPQPVAVVAQSVAPAEAAPATAPVAEETPAAEAASPATPPAPATKPASTRSRSRAATPVTQ